MKVDYQNTVIFNSSSEQPFSLARKLDQWGTRLVSPHAGNVYTIVKDKNGNYSAVLHGTDEGKQANRWFQKVKVIIGIFLKKIAAFLDSTIKAKYQLASGITPSSPLERRAAPIRQGDGDVADCCACIASCCECFVTCLECCSDPARPRHHGGRRHGHCRRY